MAPVRPRKCEEGHFHVHLTGFGPFRNYTINPSWEAVRPLNETLLSAPPAPLNGATSLDPPSESASSHRPIRLTASLLPVKYTSALSMVPALHARTKPDFCPDLIIHVGVGLEGAVRLEQSARKVGYEKPDADGEMARVDEETGRKGHVGVELKELAAELRTRIDGQRVVNWVREKGLEHVELSEDAGLYLCEFTYFASLVSALRQNPSHPLPVQFIHVPPTESPYSIEQLTRAIQLLVWAIVNEGGLSSSCSPCPPVLHA
ncbi:hypothetical protein JCM21900_005139 [Sporobolomyces salmonicolor]